MKKMKLTALSLLLAAPLAVNAADRASYKDGFTHLIQDPQILSEGEFSEVKKMPESVALFFDGDRLHRKVPKSVTSVVEDQLTMKLVKSNVMEVADCSDCKKTKILILKDAMRVEKPASTTKQFKELGEKVGADAFMMWDANETDGRFNLDLRLVTADTGRVIWSKEYSDEISTDDVELGYSEIEWRTSVSSWGLTSTRMATTGGSEATLSGVTAISIDRMMKPHDNKDVSYSIGLKHFQNTSGEDLFEIDGFALGARVYLDMGRMFDRVPYSIYGGVNNIHYNDSRGFMFDGGIEMPFAKHGYMSFGFVQLSGDQITWDAAPGYEDASDFGGIGYDFTIGFNF